MALFLFSKRGRTVIIEILRKVRAMVRIGVIGSGNIARRFISEASYVDDAEITAVYNPNVDSARRMADEKNIEAATDDWGYFLSLIDAGYIAVPHTSHMEYVRRLLNDGKHVLCEKPMSLSKEELKEALAITEEKNLVCMEALKTAYAPGFIRLLSDVRKIGQVYEVDAAFTKLMKPDRSRVFRTDMAGGSFTELGSYPLIPVMKILGTDPKEIRFHSFYDDHSDVDIYTKAILMYEDAIADIKVGIGAKTEGNLVVTGSEGYILAPSPWWLTRTYDICYEDRSRNEHVEVPFEGDGLRYEIREFVRIIIDEGTVSEKIQKESLFLAGAMEEFLEG